MFGRPEDKNVAVVQPDAASDEAWLLNLGGPVEISKTIKTPVLPVLSERHLAPRPDSAGAERPDVACFQTDAIIVVWMRPQSLPLQCDMIYGPSYGVLATDYCRSNYFLVEKQAQIYLDGLSQEELLLDPRTPALRVFSELETDFSDRTTPPTISDGTLHARSELNLDNDTFLRLINLVYEHLDEIYKFEIAPIKCRGKTKINFYVKSEQDAATRAENYERLLDELFSEFSEEHEEVVCFTIG